MLDPLPNLLHDDRCGVCARQRRAARRAWLERHGPALGFVALVALMVLGDALTRLLP